MTNRVLTKKIWPTIIRFAHGGGSGYRSKKMLKEFAVKKSGLKPFIEGRQNLSGASGIIIIKKFLRGAKEKGLLIKGRTVNSLINEINKAHDATLETGLTKEQKQVNVRKQKAMDRILADRKKEPEAKEKTTAVKTSKGTPPTRLSTSTVPKTEGKPAETAPDNSLFRYPKVKPARSKEEPEEESEPDTLNIG